VVWGLHVPLTATPGPLFTPEWVAAVKGTPESGMTATGQVVRLGQRVYDPATNTYTYPDRMVLYSGKMRVQPLRTATPRIMPNDTTSAQTVLISMPIAALDGLDIQTGDRVIVTASPLNAQLTELQYIIKEFMDSGNPVERTVLCEVNQEMRV
jgi:hypothetical protein